MRPSSYKTSDGRLKAPRAAHAPRVAVTLHATAPKPILVDFEQILLDERRQLEIIEEKVQIFRARQDEAKRVLVVGIAVPRARTVAAALALGRAIGDFIADSIFIVAGNDSARRSGGVIQDEARF